MNHSFQKQQQNDLEGTGTKVLDDESILNLVSPGYNGKPIQYNNDSSNSKIQGNSAPSNSNNKPIGYERHEKQINGNLNPQANGNLNGQAPNVPIGMQLNNLNIDEFSCNWKK